ncbi:MAG: SAM-dependent methyltransferase, partial [Actinomycetota bacterium]|nr:SAM-dependent methyltransferase [Actinomycetota bacterium]
MERPSWAPEGIDLERPSAARVYDYFLGGAHNFAADRGLAEMIASMTPDIGNTMRANRSFLRRAVRFMLAEGIDQFLDLGSGIPTVGNVHEVVRQANPEGRVLYVDVDPIAVSHSQAILEHDERTVAIQADVRELDRILEDPETARMLDLTRPVGVLLLGVLHFVPDSDDPAGIVARIRDVIAPGSYVALVNATDEDQPREVIEAQKLSSRTGTPIFLRSRAELAAQHDGLTPVEPGLVHLPMWRPDTPVDVGDHPERFGALGV